MLNLLKSFLKKDSQLRLFIALMTFFVGMQVGAADNKAKRAQTAAQQKADLAAKAQAAAQQRAGLAAGVQPTSTVNLTAARGQESKLQAERERQERIRMRPAGRVALQKEIVKQAERDNIATPSLQTVVASKEADKFTQTEALLNLANIRELITKNYKVEPYLDTVSTVIANEARYRNTHYAFYNTTSNMWRLSQDLYTRLYARFNPEKVKKGFTFLRFNDESVDTSAQGFLVNELKTKGLVDDNTDTKFIMLSVNLSLFGNVGFPGECSWEYFVNPQNHAKPIRVIYENMMKKFGLTDKYIDQLMALAEIYDTKEDTIIQVLVPKNKIDQIGYLAWVKGIPAHGATISWVLGNAKSKRFQHVSPTMEKLTQEFASQKESNPLYKDMMASIQAGDFSLDAFLKIYCNTPWEIKEINDVTARLLFTPDVLLNPESGVKFYRFSPVHRNKLKEYSNKLNALIEKIVAEKDAQDDKGVQSPGLAD